MSSPVPTEWCAAELAISVVRNATQTQNRREGTLSKWQEWLTGTDNTLSVTRSVYISTSCVQGENPPNVRFFPFALLSPPTTSTTLNSPRHTSYTTPRSRMLPKWSSAPLQTQKNFWSSYLLPSSDPVPVDSSLSIKKLFHPTPLSDPYCIRKGNQRS